MYTSKVILLLLSADTFSMKTTEPAPVATIHAQTNPPTTHFQFNIIWYMYAFTAEPYNHFTDCHWHDSGPTVDE